VALQALVVLARRGVIALAVLVALTARGLLLAPACALAFGLLVLAAGAAA